MTAEGELRERQREEARLYRQRMLEEGYSPLGVYAVAFAGWLVSWVRGLAVPAIIIVIIWFIAS